MSRGSARVQGTDQSGFAWSFALFEGGPTAVGSPNQGRPFAYELSFFKHKLVLGRCQSCRGTLRLPWDTLTNHDWRELPWPSLHGRQMQLRRFLTPAAAVAPLAGLLFSACLGLGWCTLLGTYQDRQRMPSQWASITSVGTIARPHSLGTIAPQHAAWGHMVRKSCHSLCKVVQLGRFTTGWQAAA